MSAKTSYRPVCANCKLRKKKKGLDCQDSSTATDIKYFTVQSKPPFTTSSPIIRSSLLLSNTLSDVLQSEPTNIDSTLYLQVFRIIRTAGLLVDDFSDRYFRGIHSFIPIISRIRFNDHLVRCGGSPSASFSVLLLSMCLITYHPELTTQALSPIDQATLYLTTKSLYTQVQSTFPASLHLIQAGVLISAYEYATRKPHDAFASISICARMGYAARLHLASPVEGLDPITHLQAEEETNTWWGIVICERTFFCELVEPQQPLASRVPSRDARLPTEPEAPNYDPALPPGSIPSSVSFAHHPGGFACMAQATWLLDDVFQALAEADLDVRLGLFDRLDQALRKLLAVFMEQSQGRWGPFCTANAIIIRALFIVHYHVIGQTARMSRCQYRSPEQWRESSFAALDTVSRMVEDISTTQNYMSLQAVDTLPPSRAFVIREALQYIDKFSVNRDHWDAARDQLKASLRMFDHRWDVSY
ncbi:hypothetical protein BBP40_009941 [Aspergillus hancockii]|nr:hypothetical protein BBP40_009941 [Aspergillus hancockii]